MESKNLPPKKLPSKLWYAVAVALIVLGPITGLTIFFSELWGNVDKLIKLSAKGDSIVNIQQPGTYMLSQATPQQADSVNVMKIVVKDLNNDAQETFSINRFRNIENGAIGEIAFSQAGRYEISIQSDGNSAQVLNLSMPKIRDLLRTGITSLFIFIMGIIGGTILAISVFLIRSRALRDREQKALLSQDEDSSDARTWAAFCHLSAFIGFFVPFGNIFAPLILWLLRKNHYQLVNDQGREAVNFQISVTLYYLICIILMLILVGILFAIALTIFTIIVVIIASLEASNGKYYRYPLAIRFIR